MTALQFCYFSRDSFSFLSALKFKMVPLSRPDDVVDRLVHAFSRTFASREFFHQLHIQFNNFAKRLFFLFYFILYRYFYLPHFSSRCFSRKIPDSRGSRDKSFPIFFTKVTVLGYSGFLGSSITFLYRRVFHTFILLLEWNVRFRFFAFSIFWFFPNSFYSLSLIRIIPLWNFLFLFIDTGPPRMAEL